MNKVAQNIKRKEWAGIMYNAKSTCIVSGFLLNNDVVQLFADFSRDSVNLFHGCVMGGEWIR